MPSGVYVHKRKSPPIEKSCKGCGMIKPVSEFYKVKKIYFQTYCKPCLAIIGRQRQRRCYTSEKYKERAKKSSEAMMKSFRTSVAKFPEKYRARYLFRHAVARGTVKKLPCQVCGKIKVEGHHPDYSKPLEVIWLCKKHHAEIHRIPDGPITILEVRRKNIMPKDALLKSKN